MPPDDQAIAGATGSSLRSGSGRLGPGPGRGDSFRRRKMETVGRLAGAVAHDVNNLLTAILLNSDVLALHLAEQKLAALAETTRMSAERASDLIGRLLAFLREQQTPPQAIDANAVVESVGSILSRTLGGHIALQILPVAREATVMADPGQLESAILNLALNARDAMPSGGRLVITTRDGRLGNLGKRNGRRRSFVMIEVADNGVGMPPEVLARAGEAFFTTKQDGRGTGLGLNSVQAFVREAGGRLLIESRPGGGAVVTIALPVVPEARADRRRFDCDEDIFHGSESILLVEDDRIVRAHIEAALMELGYRVVGVSNAAQALAGLLAAGVPDLLVTNLVFPGGIDGCELAGRLRACRPGLKVLYTSGEAITAATAARIEREQGSAFLAKPFRRQGLAASVRALLDGGSRPEFPHL